MLLKNFDKESRSKLKLTVVEKPSKDIEVPSDFGKGKGKGKNSEKDGGKGKRGGKKDGKDKKTQGAWRQHNGHKGR